MTVDEIYEFTSLLKKEQEELVAKLKKENEELNKKLSQINDSLGYAEKENEQLKELLNKAWYYIEKNTSLTSEEYKLCEDIDDILKNW